MGYKEQIRSVKDYIRLPLCYNHWYVAGLAEEFGEEPVSKTLLERSLVFYRTESGDLVAMQDRCLHRSFPLSKGFREGDNLVCRYHGIRYAPDGSIDRRIGMPVKNITSVMFGGDNLDVLYVTSMARVKHPAVHDMFAKQVKPQCLAGSVFAVTGLGIKGLPEPRFGG